LFAAVNGRFCGFTILFLLGKNHGRKAEVFDFLWREIAA